MKHKIWGMRENTGKNKVSWTKLELQRMLTKHEIHIAGCATQCVHSYHKGHLQKQLKHGEFPIRIKVVNIILQIFMSLKKLQGLKKTM